MKYFLTAAVALCLAAPPALNAFLAKYTSPRAVTAAEIRWGDIKCDPSAKAGDRAAALLRNQCFIDKLNSKRGRIVDSDLIDLAIASSKVIAEKFYTGRISQAEESEMYSAKASEINSEFQRRTAMRYTASIESARERREILAPLASPHTSFNCVTTSISISCN